ncbi:tubulin polyglutamylase TTLL13P-like [Elysia marginata]|uniref:Tubulin polyglutamylase TTLL13P-like n=1 Tax=Elysia marginata TaxID=1093978 RepID=A0AAV4HKX4_9GAST|nr:tubulin polyglutamylase TTLL13P-like [Elysia marginata]
MHRLLCVLCVFQAAESQHASRGSAYTLQSSNYSPALPAAAGEHTDSLAAGLVGADLSTTVPLATTINSTPFRHQLTTSHSTNSASNLMPSHSNANHYSPNDWGQGLQCNPSLTNISLVSQPHSNVTANTSKTFNASHSHASHVTTMFSKGNLMHLDVASSSLSSHSKRHRLSFPSSHSARVHPSARRGSSPSSLLALSSNPASPSHPRASSAYSSTNSLANLSLSPHKEISFHPSSSTLSVSPASFSSSFRFLAKHAASSLLQPSYAQRWQNRGASLANLNERTVPAYQRSKLARKPLGAVARPGQAANAVQEVEYRTMSSLLDTEAERSRLLAKAGYQGYQNSLQQQQQQQHQEFRSDSSSTPSSRTRAISAKQKDQQELSRIVPQVGQGLSVVSAPAPVALRPDVISPSITGFNKLPPPQQIATSDNSHKSTKSQRVRGASNSIRLRQLEMRENHAFVYS